MNENTNLQMLERIRAGEKGAFAELVRRYQDTVHGLAYHLTQDASAAEDLTQETFLDAYLHLSTLRDPQKLGAWLRSITYHHSMDWLSRTQETLPVDEVSADRPSVETTVERQEMYELLSSILQTLSEPHRVVITLKYMEGLSNSQIADFLDLSQSAVDTRLHRALKQLQERMLKGLETGFQRLDEHFAAVVCREIEACRPLIGVAVRVEPPHRFDRCTCASRVRELADRTGGLYQEVPGQGWAILYGMNQIHEADAMRAVQSAQELRKQPCPGGPCYFSVGRVMARHAGSEGSLRPDLRIGKTFPFLMDLASSSGILVDSTIAWVLRYDFGFEAVRRPGLSVSAHRIVSNPSTDVPGNDSTVGRHAERVRLEEAIQHLRVGGGSIVQITGEAGIGKTHLLHALRQCCEGKSLIWLEGKAKQGFHRHPSSPPLSSPPNWGGQRGGGRGEYGATASAHSGGNSIAF